MQLWFTEFSFVGMWKLTTTYDPKFGSLLPPFSCISRCTLVFRL